MCLVLPGVEVEAQDVLDNIPYVSLKKLVSLLFGWRIRMIVTEFSAIIY